MILVKVDAMVVLATGVTTTTGMLAVLSNTTMAVTHMAPQLSCLAESGWLFVFQDEVKEAMEEMTIVSRRSPPTQSSNGHIGVQFLLHTINLPYLMRYVSQMSKCLTV